MMNCQNGRMDEFTSAALELHEMTRCRIRQLHEYRKDREKRTENKDERKSPQFDLRGSSSMLV